MIAAVYARKSTEDTRSKEEGRSTARQIENATTYATAQGWTVDPDLIFVDENISGGEFVSRPGLAACRAAAAAHRFEKLVVMERSRIGRDTIRTLAAIEEMEEAGIEVHAYGDGRGLIRSGDVGTLVGAWSDTEEKKNASRRTREGLIAKARKGHATGPAPYGYRTVRLGEHSEYQVNDEQAAVVRQAFQWSAEGLGDHRVRNRLAELTGRPWTKTSVGRLLGNPVYTGHLVFGRTKTAPRGGKAKRRERLAEPAVIIEKPDLRIIDQPLWQRVQARKATTRAHYAAGETTAKPASAIVTKYALTGILRCSECGATMTMLGRRRRLRYYCLGRAHKGAAACSNKGGVPMEVLDQAVITVLLDELLSDHDRLWSIIREREDQQVAAVGPVVDTSKEIRNLEAEIRRMVSALATGKASASITTAIAEREARVELLRAKPTVQPITKAEVVTGYAKFRMMINRKHPAEVRALLARLGCSRIMVTRTGPHTWDFAGEFDAGRIVTPTPPYPAEPSLIETDARGYLLKIAPTRSAVETIILSAGT
jgi:site-specific DNA recombinase